MKLKPADAGANARPWPFEDGDPLAPPKPVPDGPFLLIMHDENVSGGLWMRRYATKADALAIACNYTGAKETWLFEVSQTFDMAAEHERFWSSIGF